MFSVGLQNHFQNHYCYCYCYELLLVIITVPVTGALFISLILYPVGQHLTFISEIVKHEIREIRKSGISSNTPATTASETGNMATAGKEDTRQYLAIPF